MGLYGRIAAAYRPYLPAIAAATVMMLAGVAFNLLKPWPLAWLIDTVLVNRDGAAIQLWGWSFDVPSAIASAAAATILITLGAGLFGLANHYLLIRIALKALLALRTKLYDCLQHHSLQFHDRRRSGDSTFRVAYDAQAIQTFFNQGFSSVFNAIVTLLTTFVIMWQMDTTLALLSFAVIPLLWGAIFLFAKRVRRQSATKQQQESDVLARASEGLSSIRIVHAFGREDYEVAAFKEEAKQAYDANLNLEVTNALTTLVVGVIMALGTALILYVGAYHVIDGKLQIGQLVVFISYLTMLYQPLEQLSYTAWAMTGATAGMQRVYEVLDAEDTVPEKPHAPALNAPSGAIAFKHVDFHYTSGEPILRGLSLKIPAGQTVALVGGTGAGKTTLLSLVPRFYDPAGGSVRIDGTDLRDVAKRSVRDHIAMVLQDTVLLSGTVRDNIAYGKLGATEDEIFAAAKEAQALDFIRALPQGLDTEVGERGVRLSGGQKQRIGIARAFLKAAPILLLDEPTSALDLETEAEIMGTLRSLMRRQTTLIVTHRLATIHDVDRIFVLQHGQVVEQGTGPELVHQNGAYARLWKTAKDSD